MCPLVYKSPHSKYGSTMLITFLKINELYSDLGQTSTPNVDQLDNFVDSPIRQLLYTCIANLNNGWTCLLLGQKDDF